MTQTPANIPLTIYQGATLRQSYQLLDANRDPINLTGFSVRAQGRLDFTSASTLFDLSTTNGKITVPTPSNGTLILNMTAADTAALAFDVGVYDIEIVSPGGTVDRVVKGKLTLDKEVTK